MTNEPWNRVNIPFPGAVSTVRVGFNSNTDSTIAAVLAENERILKVMRSEILQTEVRVLYELLFTLRNSFRQNKTFKALQRVEQCITRLKSMEVDAALQELAELCPGRFHRELSVTSGECGVPSQPALEWICLKVLGAARLMSCTLNRCSRAFSLSRQQMKWEEFVVLNVVITSMLGRLWVIFRGLLCCLSALYQDLLQLLEEVFRAAPMPFLTDFSLPADISRLIHPSAADLLSKRPAEDPKEAKPRNNSRRAKKDQEDLGVAIERGLIHDTGAKPFLKTFSHFTKGQPRPQNPGSVEMKQKFRKQLRGAATFSDLETCVQEMILCCRSLKMRKEKRLLTFLHLKCQKMKSLESSTGTTRVQRKLESFRAEARRALSPGGPVLPTCRALCPGRPVPPTCRAPAARRTGARFRAALHLLRSRFKSSALRAGRKARRRRARGTSRKFPVSTPSEEGGRKRGTWEESCNGPAHDRRDDIDNIFASVGL